MPHDMSRRTFLKLLSGGLAGAAAGGAFMKREDILAFLDADKAAGEAGQDWPIMLTAAAAILGMIPLMKSVFWGPLAVAIASGLFVATVLTLLVLPTMYAAWFKVKRTS